MKSPLVEMMAQMTSLTPSEEKDIITSFPIKSYPKGKYLLRDDQIANNSFFILNGCIREFEIVNGEEKTTAFYTENQTASNYYSLLNRVCSRKNFVCMEATTFAVFNVEKEKEFYIRNPRFESFCREGSDKLIGEQQDRIAKYITMSPEERYLDLIENEGNLVTRVPQYHLASYLGIKPETLSRIRKRIARKVHMV